MAHRTSAAALTEGPVTEADDWTRSVVPENVAVNVLSPATCVVIWQVTMPSVSVTPEHCAPSSLKSIVLPTTGAIGSCELSVSEAITLTGTPGDPALGLGLRVRNVTCFQGPQITRALFELIAVLLTVADATIMSVPSLTAV